MYPHCQMSFQHSSVYNPAVGLCGLNYTLSYGQNVNWPFSYLLAENQKLKAEMNVMSTHRKWEHFARQNQAAQLTSVLQREKHLLEENNKLIAKNAMLTNSLKFAKDEIDDLELQLKKEVTARETEAFHLKKTILQNVQQIPACNEERLAKNSLLRDSLKTTKNRLEDINSKQEQNKLEDQLCKVKSELEQRIAEVNALTAVNEMLLHGNEKRDETIKKFKKKLQKLNNLSSSSDKDSMLENSALLNSMSNYSSRSVPLQQPRRFGCKALHALSSLGADNTLGPWLCVTCGINESPMNFLSYSEFHRHLTEVHKEAIDPALCAQCGWRSENERELQLHTYKKHEIDALFHTPSKSAILGI